MSWYPMNRLLSPASTTRLLFWTGKGRIHVRILFHHLDVLRKTFISAQKIFDHIILFSCLDDPVNGHVVFQGAYHGPGVSRHRIEFGGAHVIFCHIFRQCPGQNIKDHHQGQDNGC